MKFITVLFFTAVLWAGCTSSDKKSTEQTQESVSDTIRAEMPQLKETVIKAQEYSEEADTTGLVKITGQLNYTGNEPFAEPAIFVSGSEMYKLTADDTFMNETFDELNGKRVSIYGVLRDAANTTALEVHYYELSEN